MFHISLWQKSWSCNWEKEGEGDDQAEEFDQITAGPFNCGSKTLVGDLKLVQSCSHSPNLWHSYPAYHLFIFHNMFQTWFNHVHSVLIFNPLELTKNHKNKEHLTKRGTTQVCSMHTENHIGEENEKSIKT